MNGSSLIDYCRKFFIGCYRKLEDLRKLKNGLHGHLLGLSIICQRGSVWSGGVAGPISAYLGTICAGEGLCGLHAWWGVWNKVARQIRRQGVKASF